MAIIHWYICLLNQSESSNSFFLFFAEGFGGAFLAEKSSSSSLNKFFLAGGFYSAF
jgi:hypothetical protein